MTFSPALSAALEGPSWLRDSRKQAAGDLEGTPFPNTTSELWRYSRVEDINLDSYQLASKPSLDLSDEARELAAATGGEDSRFVAIDGSEVVNEGGPSLLRGQAYDNWTGTAGPEGVDVFGVLNAAFVRDVAIIDIPAGSVVERPILVVNHIATNGIAVFPRTLIRAGEASQVTIVELHTSADVKSLTAPVVETIVGDGANVNYINIQLLGEQMNQVGYNISHVGRDATFSSTTIALGGSYARVRTDSHLTGQGGTSNLRAVYFGTGNQMHDFRTLQAHQAPRSTSDLLFKGAIGDKARSVYSGLIRVDKGASGTNAFQTNRNLVLSAGAHAESVPNLEIEENDVKCSHASAVGPIDEEQRYYLESRGVPTNIAERLIAVGFLKEMIETIPVKSLRPVLHGHIESKLAGIVES